MLVLILGILVLIFVIFLFFLKKTKNLDWADFNIRTFYMVMSWLFGVLCIGLIVVICILMTEVATANILDDKIAMYQEENTAIEQDIDKIVKEYLAHEHDTFADLKTEESSITLVTLFPELKSDNLVQQQLEIYVANNANIKRLKEEKIDISKKKWILYFGR